MVIGRYGKLKSIIQSPKNDNIRREVRVPFASPGRNLFKPFRHCSVGSTFGRILYSTYCDHSTSPSWAASGMMLLRYLSWNFVRRCRKPMISAPCWIVLSVITQSCRPGGLSRAGRSPWARSHCGLTMGTHSQVIRPLPAPTMIFFPSLKSRNCRKAM